MTQTAKQRAHAYTTPSPLMALLRHEVDNIEGGGGCPVTLDDINVDFYSEAEALELFGATKSDLSRQLAEAVEACGSDAKVQWLL